MQPSADAVRRYSLCYKQPLYLELELFCDYTVSQHELPAQGQMTTDCPSVSKVSQSLPVPLLQQGACHL